MRRPNGDGGGFGVVEGVENCGGRLEGNVVGRWVRGEEGDMIWWVEVSGCDLDMKWQRKQMVDCGTNVSASGYGQCTVLWND